MTWELNLGRDKSNQIEGIVFLQHFLKVGIGDLLMQMVEAASAKFVVIVDETKVCAFQFPSEILGWKTTCIQWKSSG